MDIASPRNREPELNIRVATPCRASWEDMEGDDRARFCLECSKHVYNLSAMNRTEAMNLIRGKEGDLCGRFYRRADGTILYGEDCPVGLAARQWRKVKGLAGAAASLVLTILGLNTAHADDQTGSVKKPPASFPPNAGGPIMGKICPVNPTPAPSPTPKPTAPPARGE